MYNLQTRENWEQILHFPKGYTVDYLIAAAVTKREKNVRIFDECIKQIPGVEMPNLISEEFFRGVQEYKINGKTIWFDIVYGGAYLSELLHIACLFGSRKNFLIGTCGGLQTNLNAGDIIIPTYSYGNESTTRTYQRENKDNKHYSNEDLSKSIIESIDKRYKTYRGSLVTCQAMMGETLEDVTEWQKEGYLGVEMESSTFFAISNHFNVPSTALLHVSDNLVKNELYGGEAHESSKSFREGIKIYKYEVVLKNILSD